MSAVPPGFRSRASSRIAASLLSYKEKAEVGNWYADKQKGQESGTGSTSLTRSKGQRNFFYWAISLSAWHV